MSTATRRTPLPLMGAAALSVLALPQAAHAKRLPPATVKAVVTDGVRYTVPHFGALHGKQQNGGYVQAWEVGSGKLLWDRMVYRTVRDEVLERDVQDVFISRIGLKGRTLLVENELGETFEMDLDTGKVKAVVKKSDRTEIPPEAASPP